MFQLLGLDTNKLYKRTMDHYGAQIQYATACEEMAELEQALSKLLRVGHSESEKKDEVKRQVLTEMGDSLNMIEQVLHLLGSLDVVNNMMDLGATRYENDAHIIGETGISMAKLKIELYTAVNMEATGLGNGVDPSTITVYSGEVFRGSRTSFNTSASI